MSEHDPLDENRAAADEVRAASRLAGALDGDAQSGADLESLAVVRLFETVSAGAGADELAARRLRNELTARAPRRPRLRTVGRVAAAAAALSALGLLSVFFRHSTMRPNEEVLALREEAARAAVVVVAGSWSGECEPSQRIVEVSEQQWRLRLVTRLDSERLEQLASEGSEGSAAGSVPTAPRATRTIPTPGGSS